MPAVDILDFMEKKANDWQLCVETFSSQHQDKLIAAIEESIISNEEDVLASPKSSTLTSMYQTMLHFYYDMYIYRIKNMAVLDLLRVWIWIVANIPLLHAIHMHEEASASAVQVPSKESATFSIEEMQEVLKASLWMQKHCPKGSIQQQYITKIQNFHDSLQTCLKQASECRNSVEAISVFPQLQAYKHFIGIDHALTYAKVLCFLRPAQIRLQLGDLKQQQISLSETFLQPEVSTNPTQEEDTLLEATVDHDVLAAVPSKESQSTLRPVMESTIQQSIDTLEQYLNQIINHDSADIFCWCRHEDDQHLMLGCDRCNDWFHATCVGISSKGSSKASASTASQSIANKKKRKFHKINTSKLEHESAEYLCLSCSSCLHREYPYAW